MGGVAMAYRVSFDGVPPSKALFVLLSLFGSAAIHETVFPTDAGAQYLPSGYEQADSAFVKLNIDQRLKLQILLTAAGYWPAVPNTDFSTRLFKAIRQFEVDNSFVPLEIINSEQMERLTSIGGSFLTRWDFVSIRHPHPLANSQIWVPRGLPVTQESTSTGLKFTNPSYGFILTYDFFPDFSLRNSFESLLHKLERSGAKIYYSDLYRDQFFVLSYSDGITDAYVRYHQMGRSGVGITLYWNHDAADAHIERIATLISGSLWSSAGGGPFIYPFTVSSVPPETARPNPEAQPAPSVPQQSEPHRAGSGTGIFVTDEGHLITNAHVVKDCLEIRVGLGSGNFEVGSLAAKDPTNDLALLKVNAKPPKVGALRFGVRVGENVEAFGYPLSQVLATSGNFTTGNVTALAGRFYQISAPVQPGNSGGPLLDENGNLVGIVTSKLNVWNEIKAQGDIPENVNFAIKASVAANFLQDNGIKFQIGEATQAMKGPELADQAKALSAYVECR
jgi:S1-C subfamily serine protease